MVRATYCSECGYDIDPAIYGGCERAYTIGAETVCEGCFKDWVIDWLETSPEMVALAIGVDVLDMKMEEAG